MRKLTILATLLIAGLFPNFLCRGTTYPYPAGTDTTTYPSDNTNTSGNRCC